MEPNKSELREKASQYWLDTRRDIRNKLIQRNRDRILNKQEEEAMAKLADEMTLLSFNYDNDRYDCVWVTAARLLGVDFLKVSFALEELRSRLGETRGAGLNTLERICEIFDQALRYRVLDQGNLDNIKATAHELANQLNTNRAGLLYSRDPTRFKTGHCIVYEKLDLSSANAGMTAEQWRFVDYQVLDARNYGDRESAPWTTIDAPHFNDNSAKFPVMVFAISPFNPKTFN